MGVVIAGILLCSVEAWPTLHEALGFLPPRAPSGTGNHCHLVDCDSGGFLRRGFPCVICAWLSAVLTN